MGTQTGIQILLKASEAKNQKIRELEAENATLRTRLAAAEEALLEAEKHMTKIGGQGCYCECPVTDGHTGKCKVISALKAARKEVERG